MNPVILNNCILYDSLRLMPIILNSLVIIAKFYWSYYTTGRSGQADFFRPAPAGPGRKKSARYSNSNLFYIFVKPRVCVKIANVWRLISFFLKQILLKFICKFCSFIEFDWISFIYLIICSFWNSFLLFLSFFLDSFKINI